MKVLLDRRVKLYFLFSSGAVRYNIIAHNRFYALLATEKTEPVLLLNRLRDAKLKSVHYEKKD